MTLTIDGYTVEIKAKSEFNKRYNREDTISILNYISMMAANSAELKMRDNKTAWASRDEQIANEIYSFLRIIGAYDNF